MSGALRQDEPGRTEQNPAGQEWLAANDEVARVVLMGQLLRMAPSPVVSRTRPDEPFIALPTTCVAERCAAKLSRLFLPLFFNTPDVRLEIQYLTVGRCTGVEQQHKSCAASHNRHHPQLRRAGSVGESGNGRCESTERHHCYFSASVSAQAVKPTGPAASGADHQPSGSVGSALRGDAGTLDSGCRCCR